MKNTTDLALPQSGAYSWKILLHVFSIKLLIVVLLFNGFITNFLSLTQANAGTLLVDILVLLLFTHLFVRFVLGYYQRLQLSRAYFGFLVFWLILLFLTVLKLSFLDSTSITERLLGVRNNLLYMVPLLYIPIFFKREASVEEILRLFLKLSLLLAIFSLIQFTFASKLPTSLLVLRGETVFGFYQSNIIRPTALLGNTIIYASFTLFAFSFYFSKYLHQGKRSDLILLIIIGLANILTFTRAALVGMVIVIIVCLILRYARPTLLFLIRIGAALLVIVMISLAGLYFYKDSFLVQRLTGKEVSTQGSTNEHIMQIEHSILYLKQNPISGAGIGSQGPSGDPAHKIITDGYWFQVMLEHGIPLGVLYVLIHISCVVFALRTFYKFDNMLLRQLCMAFVALSAYFFAASFLNSAYTGRVNFISYWLLFGILLAQYIILQKQRYAYPSH